MTRSAPVARTWRVSLFLCILSGWIGFSLPVGVADDEPATPTENQATDPAAPQPQAEENQPAAPAEKPAADPPAKKPPLRNWFKDALNDIFPPRDETKEKKPAVRPAPRPRAPIQDPREHLPGSENIDPRIPDTHRLRKALDEARSSLEKQEWKTAAQQLQRILDEPEETFTPSDGTTNKNRLWTSLKDEALHLLGQLPAEEMRNYRAAYDGIAAKRLEAAKAEGSFYDIVTVARRYFYTAAGQQSADMVASHYLDRGEFGLADRWFKTLSESEAPVTTTAVWRAKAALAETLLADGANGPKSVEFTPGEAATLGGREQDLGAWLGSISGLPRPEADLAEWPLFMGNARRTGQPIAGEPLLLSRWYTPLTRSHRVETQIRELVGDLRNERDEQYALVPALVPLMVDGKLVFRTLQGVRVMDAVTGASLWETQDLVSAEALLTDGNYQGAWGIRGQRIFANFRGYRSRSYRQNPLANLLFEDANYGIVSSDGQRLFVLEDLAVLTKQPQQYWGSTYETDDRFGQNWSSNKITAYDLNSGRPQWEVGGAWHGDTFELPLAGYFFHGVPVCDGGELFVVGERERLIELFCLDAASGELLWQQPIAQATAEIDRDIVRRWYGGQIAVGNGTIVCQTTTGLVAAVERESHALLWSADAAHLPAPTANRVRGRRQADVAPVEEFNSRWFPAPPMISGNRVVVTAPRGSYLHCYDLTTGTGTPGRDWQLNKGEDLLYLAGVFGDRVVVVGKEDVRGYRLENGFEDWTAKLPAVPSGRGVAVGGRYYVPLASDELVGIDLERGDVVERLIRPAGSRGLGNLAMYRGTVISVTPFGVESFEQRPTVEQEIADRKSRDPDDPVALLREAEIAELNRDVTTVLDKVRTLDADGLAPADRMRYRTVYFRALAALIRSDFSQHDAAVEELQQLADSPDERRAAMRLTADRLVARHDFSGAFAVYLELASTIDGEMIRPDAESPVEVRDDYWLAGRILDLWDQLPAELRPEFDRRVEQLADKVAGGSIEDQRHWLTLFGFHPASLTIQRQLVEHYAGNGDLVAAEDLLFHIRDHFADDAAAAAVLRHAELLAAAGAAGAADDAFNLVETRYPRTELSDGKTAAEVARAARAAHDVSSGLKRHLSPDWGSAPLTAVRMGQDYSQRESLFPLIGLDHEMPYFGRHQFHVRAQDQRLEILRGDGDEYLASIPLRGDSHRNAAGVPAHNRGHHMLLLHQGMLHSISPLEGKVRWVRPVEGTETPNTYQVESGINVTMKTSLDSAVKQQGGPRSQVPYLFDQRHFLYRSGRQITVVDAVTGDVCWTMDNVPLDCVLFGGDGVLYRRIAKTNSGLTAIRMLDGKPIDVPHLAEYSSGAERFVGRHALFANRTRDSVQLALRDPANGEQVWTQSFPAKSLGLLKDDENLLIVTPAGKFSELNLRTGQARPLGEIAPDILKSRNPAYCLMDNENAYLIINWGTRRTSVSYNNNLSSIRIAGKIFAFNLDDPSRNWVYDVKKPQHLILAELRDSPMLILTLPQVEEVGRRPRHRINRVNIVAINKRNGKQVLDATINMQPNFQNVRVNLPGKFIELHTYNERVRLMPLHVETAAATSEPDNDK